MIRFDKVPVGAEFAIAGGDIFIKMRKVELKDYIVKPHEMKPNCVKVRDGHKCCMRPSMNCIAVNSGSKGWSMFAR